MKPPTRICRCPECDAEQLASSGRCWLCYSPLAEAEVEEIVYAEAASEPWGARIERLMTVLGFAACGLTILVVLGSHRDAVGIALLVALCASPALLAVGIVMLCRRAPGKSVDWRAPLAVILGTIGTIVLSFAAGVVIILLLIAAAIVSFLTVCSEMLGGGP